MPSNPKQNKHLKAGVIGDPISHSLSPVLHNFWLKKYNINGSYEAIHVTHKELPTFLANLAEQGFEGINITLPHKIDAMKHTHSNGELSQSIGAINTIIKDENEQFVGRNTDCIGFTSNLKQYAPTWSATNSDALILGAGGAARAVIVGLLDQGCRHITIANRTKEKTESLALDMNSVQNRAKIEIIDWEERSDILRNHNLLVNTTQLGMTGQPSLDIDLSKLPDDAIVNDIVYTPLKTELLKAAEARGLTAIDGLGMLLWQAKYGFEAWFGKEVEVDDSLRNHVIAAMGQEL